MDLFYRIYFEDVEQYQRFKWKLKMVHQKVRLAVGKKISIPNTLLILGSILLPELDNLRPLAKQFKSPKKKKGRRGKEFVVRVPTEEYRLALKRVALFYAKYLGIPENWSDAVYRILVEFISEREVKPYVEEAKSRVA